MPAASENRITQISETVVEAKTKFTFDVMGVQDDEEQQVDDDDPDPDQPRPEARLEGLTSLLEAVREPSPLRALLLIVHAADVLYATATAETAASGTRRGWRGGCSVRAAARKVGHGRSGVMAQRPLRRK